MQSYWYSSTLGTPLHWGSSKFVRCSRRYVLHPRRFASIRCILATKSNLRLKKDLIVPNEAARFGNIYLGSLPIQVREFTSKLAIAADPVAHSTAEHEELPSPKGRRRTHRTFERRAYSLINSKHPNAVISQWLDIEDPAEKQEFYYSIRRDLEPGILPTILLEYLYRTSFPNDNSGRPKNLSPTTIITLQSRGFTEDDLSNWAWVLSGDETDQMLERFFSTSTARPSFLLSVILRRDIEKVRNLKKVLIYVWDHILSNAQKGISKLANVQYITSTLSSEVTNISSDFQALRVEESSLTFILNRLLSQARRLWPAAIPAIAQMLVPHMHSVRIKSCGYDVLDEPTYQRLCMQYNNFIRLLALPASIEPYKSMVYNWSAQKVLLELGEQFDPPLSLDNDSYLAVVQVLAASSKTERESIVARLRSRAWPPWREAQDGMDAQSTPEDDLSRVVLALGRKIYAGYESDFRDKVFNILGGYEEDGTPTIHTRKLVKIRSGLAVDSTSPQGIDGEKWAARIEATRDVQEAWSAFVGYKDRGGNPTLSMYFTMFEKLNYESARLGRNFQHEVTPGDGKEVLPPLDDNFSEFYQSHRQPPTIDALYDQMIESGIIPQGRCLIFLVQHASSLYQALVFLHHSRMFDANTLAYLAGDKRALSSFKSLEKIPRGIFSAFMHVLCRFISRIERADSTVESDLDESDEISNTRRVLELKKMNPLLHATELLQNRPTGFKPTWYSLFQALANKGTVISRDLAGQPKNDILAWQVLDASLRDFHNCGLELDPRGFQIICVGFVKAVLASEFETESQNEILGGLQTIKDEFMNLSESNPAPHGIPKLLHSIHGAHLHAYVRVLGVTGDYEEMLLVLEWMVSNRRELEFIAKQSRNGSKLLRRVIVAMKVFFTDTDYEEIAQHLVERSGGWGKWPGSVETRKYIEEGFNRS